MSLQFLQISIRSVVVDLNDWKEFVCLKFSLGISCKVYFTCITYIRNIISCSREKGASMVDTVGKNAEFAEFDINDDKSLESALAGVLALQKYIAVSTT